MDGINMARYAWDTGGLVAILGLATVFAVLAIIMFILMIMERIFAKQTMAKKEAPVQKAEPVEVTEPKKEEPVKEVVAAAKATDDAELVAVITAAIAASMGVPERSLKIKSFKRVGRAWSDASRQENVYNSL